MAVEIPVVVDIEGAFQDAAKRVSSAIKPLESAIGGEDLIPQLKGALKNLQSARELVGKIRDELGGVYAKRASETAMPFATNELKKAVDALSRAEGIANRINFHNQVTDLSQSNIELIQMNEEYRRLEISSDRMSGSINSYKNRLAELNAQWNSLTEKQRTGAKGVGIYEEARRIVSALDNQAIGLERMIAKEEESVRAAKRAAEERAAAVEKEQARIDAIRKKREKTEQYENAIMTTGIRTLKVLQERERILSERLSRTVIGSEKYEKLKTQLQGVRQEIEKINREIAGSTNPEIAKTDSRLVSLVKNSIRLLALHSTGRFIKNVRDVTAEFELQRVALGSIIQDTERASSLFRQIKAAAVESPFEIKDLVTYTKQLSAYQIETDKLFDTTMKLADVSAGLGVDMGRLILAYGQVRAASVLRGQELRQFTEAGIPLVEKLAEKFTELNGRTVTTAEVFELISKRAVPFRMIEEIFDDMTSAGGMFYKMQEKQAETLQGQWNNLKDAISIMYDEIGRTKPVHKAMSTLISDAREMMLNWREVAKVLGIVGGALLAHVAVSKIVVLWDKAVAAAEAAATAAESTREAGIRRLTARIIGKTAAEKIATKATKVHAAAIAVADATSNRFIKTLWRLVAALANNPFGILAIGVAALIGSMTTLIGKTESVEERINSANKSIQDLAREREYSGTEEMEGLISQYEKLSKKTNLSAKETAKLRDISRELGKAFPLTTKAIDDQTGALILDIEQLKNYSKEAQESIKESMRAQIAANEGQIARYQKQQEHIQKVLERGYGFVEGSYYFGLSKDAKNAEVLRQKLIGASDATRELTQTNQDLQDAIDGVKRTTDDSREPYPPIPSGEKLDRLRKQISDITDAYKKFIELRKYLSKDASLRNIATFFPSLEGWEPTYENTIDRLTDMLGSYKGNADATRLLEQAIANIKFDKVKKDMDDALKRVSDDLKRSETARNFYDNILGLTGDRDLAANLTMSVYDTAGEDFAERMKKELVDSLSSLDAESFAGLDDAIRDAFDTGDYQYLMKNLEKVPEKLRDVVKQVASDSEKYNADFIEDMLKTYEKTKDFEERITEIRQREGDKRKKIQDSTIIPEAEKEKLLGASRQKEEQDVADVEVEALKATEEWIRTFENLDKVGTPTLEKLISMLDELIAKNGASMNAGTLRSLTKSLEQAREQVYSRKPFEAFTAGATSYIHAISAIVRARKRWKKEEDPEAEGALNAAYDQKNEALEKMKSAVDGVSDVFNNLNTIVSTATELLNFDELSNGQAILSGIATGLGKVGTALTFINAVMTMLETNPIVLAISGAVAAAVALGSVISNIKVNKANREIKEQDKLLENLEYQYSRLEKAIANAFGSDYITNYNQQLDNLYAKQEAYMKQAEAERSKGKKADEDKIKDYENNARAAADQIADMQHQLSEFFTGTDITSAAKDFATAWIDAYKEFGSVTDAMGEKFQDMLQSMVEQSLASNVIKAILNPLFQQIEEMAQTDNELSALEIASIAKDAPEYIQRINDAMGVLMNELASAGYNIRQQPGQFTGITRNIANATEDTMSGVAVGINTQNMYMMGIRQDVAQILAIMSGGAQADVSPATNVVLNNELALQYMSALPSIDANIAEMLRTFKSVVSPKSAATNTHYIAVRD